MKKHPVCYYQRIILTTLLIVVQFLSISLAAPSSSRTDIEEQNRRSRQEAQERENRERQKDVFLQEKSKSVETKLPEETPSFLIQTIKLEGDAVERFSWLQPIANQYGNQSIGMQGVNLIVKRLTNALIDKGYITTRIVIPEQNLGYGTLTLAIVPGMIQDIQIASPEISANWRTAFPARPGDVLNLRDLEQGLEQLKRIPSQDAEMQLVPGEKPGTSIVQITIKRTKPVNYTVSIDDSGSEATGKLQSSATLSVDNLFGINDLFNISLNTDAKQENVKGTRGDSVYYSFPQGYWTYTLSKYASQYHQTIYDTAQTFSYSGESDNLELKAEKLFYRDQKRKSTLGLSVLKTNSKSYIDDTEIEVQRRNTTAAKVSLNHRQYSGNTTYDVQLTYKRGVPWLGAQADPAITSGQATTRYNIWLLDTTVMMPFKLNHIEARYNINLRAQYTPNTLLASELFSIGNRYTIRGFDGEQTLTGEKGWYVRNEVSLPLAKTGQAIYIGLDCGQVNGPSASAASGKTLVGTVLGLRGAGKGAQYDIFIGKPVSKPGSLVTGDVTTGFQVTYSM